MAPTEEVPKVSSEMLSQVTPPSVVFHTPPPVAPGEEVEVTPGMLIGDYRVERLAGEITRLWLRYYDELDAIIQPAGRGTTPWAHIWAPHGRAYMLQSDFCYMISPEMFDAFMMPVLREMTAGVDFCIYHWDGPGAIPQLQYQSSGSV